MLDPDKFLNQKISEPSETNFIPVPAGEYTAVIPQGGVLPPREVKDEKTGVTQLVVDIRWDIASSDPRFKQVVTETGNEKPFIRSGIFLDVDFDEKGDVIGLSKGKGKNVALGQLREALGQNTSKDWSFRHLEGSMAKILVEHKLSKGDTFANIAKKGITKI